VALSAIRDSYMIFSPREPLMLGDAAETAVEAAAGALVVGIQMSAPFILFGLVFNLGMGILSRLMPQLQVFFIAMPATVSVGLILMAVLIATMMGLYLGHFEDTLAVLRGAA
jgi:flagellar biosynthetic protein FliR